MSNEITRKAAIDARPRIAMSQITASNAMPRPLRYREVLRVGLIACRVDFRHRG